MISAARANPDHRGAERDAAATVARPAAPLGPHRQRHEAGVEHPRFVPSPTHTGPFGSPRHARPRASPVTSRREGGWVRRPEGGSSRRDTTAAHASAGLWCQTLTRPRTSARRSLRAWGAAAHRRGARGCSAFARTIFPEESREPTSLATIQSRPPRRSNARISTFSRVDATARADEVSLCRFWCRFGIRFSPNGSHSLGRRMSPRKLTLASDHAQAHFVPLFTIGRGALLSRESVVRIHHASPLPNRHSVAPAMSLDVSDHLY